MATLSSAHVTRAFALAYFFHPDRSAAMAITTRAIAKVALAERVQARRVHYTPKGRRSRLGADPRPLRTKVSVDRPQLLQRLVLLECDLLERVREEHGSPEGVSDEEIVLRFVRALAWSSSRRNSLYVATAMGRILHGYSTAEVQDLFSVVVQEPERAPDDSYVRSVKQSLLGELKRRFGSLLRTRTGPRGEEVFESVEPSPRLRQLVDSCLERVSPWDTSCPVPRGFDALGHTLRSLKSSGGDPDAEHPIEVRRMHSLIHPECFARLTKGLRLAPPEEVLSVPRLFRPGGPPDDEAEPADRSQPPPLDDGDVERLRSGLEPKHEGGDGMSHVSLRVDGRERAQLALGEGARAHFAVNDGDEVLELFGIAGPAEMPLALHLLGARPLRGAPPAEELLVAIDRRWEVTVSVTPPGGIEDDAPPGRAEATCAAIRPTARIRRALFDDAFSWPHLPWAAVLPALALLLAAGYFVIGGQGSPAGRRGASETARATAAPREITRGETRPREPMTLERARTVYIGTLEGPEARHLEDLLAASMGASGRFQVVRTPEAADVALKGLAVRAPSAAAPAENLHLELQLVDERGRTLWSATTAGGDWESAVERALADLIADAS